MNNCRSVGTTRCCVALSLCTRAGGRSGRGEVDTGRRKRRNKGKGMGFWPSEHQEGKVCPENGGQKEDERGGEGEKEGGARVREGGGEGGREGGRRTEN